MYFGSSKEIQQNRERDIWIWKWFVKNGKEREREIKKEQTANLIN